MEHIEKAMQEAGVIDQDLTKEVNYWIGDYKRLVNAISMSEKNGRKATKATEKAETYKNRIIEEIFLIGEGIKEKGKAEEEEAEKLRLEEEAKAGGKTKEEEEAEKLRLEEEATAKAKEEEEAKITPEKKYKNPLWGL